MKNSLLRARVVVRTSNLNDCTSLFGRLRQKIAPKSVPHVQHDYFSSINQSLKSLICGVVVAVAVVIRELEQGRQQGQRRRQKTMV